jgi:hypothetical protein
MATVFVKPINMIGMLVIKNSPMFHTSYNSYVIELSVWSSCFCVLDCDFIQDISVVC